MTTINSGLPKIVQYTYIAMGNLRATGLSILRNKRYITHHVMAKV
jgi:hypothetical protein